MKLARPAYFTALLIALAGSGASAWAQAACERYRAELASLTRSGAAARSYEAAAARHRDEIGRLASYYRSIGCEGFFLFRQPPAECGAISQRIRALQANYAAIPGQAFADPSALETRRQQLRAAIARTCDAYGSDETTTTFRATGGSRLVCVRSCDGFFFPLHNDPEGRAKPADLCQALCPNAEVSVYRAPQDGGIEQAISESGKPYMQLATALRYTKTLDPSCSCRKPGESWAETLQKAERMIARRSSDIVVTATISERMSRASLSAPKVRRGRDMSTTGQAAAAVPDVETTGSIPTGGTAGAGISAEAAEVPADKGGISGSRSTPRIIAPDLIPVPRTDGAAGPRSIP